MTGWSESGTSRVLPACDLAAPFECSRTVRIRTPGRRCSPGKLTEIIDVPTGKTLATNKNYVLPETPPIFSKSESSLIFTTFQDRAVVVWPFGAAEPRRLTSGHGAICHLALTPDEKTLAISDRNGAIDIWNLESNKLEWTLQPAKAGETNAAHLLRFTRDGKLLIAAPNMAAVRLQFGISPQRSVGLSCRRRIKRSIPSP